MKPRHYATGVLIATAALLSGCGNDDNPTSATIITNPTTPPPITPPTPSMTFSQFAASLIAMVTGSACATATPSDLNGATVSDDMQAVDANTLTPNCT